MRRGQSALDGGETDDDMIIHNLHRWDLSYRDAVAVQQDLADRIRLRRLPLKTVKHVAGTDIAISKRSGMLVAAAVIFSFPQLEIVETRSTARKISFPYIPGLLSFREIPALIDCLRTVRTPVDVILCDGQGIAHPRGIGLASHLGLLLQTPTIGCAKSRLVGEHEEPGPLKGDFVPLSYNGKRVGSVLRTRDGVKPIYVSPGHLVDHAGCRRVTLACATRYRLPEPTRHAHLTAGVEKRRIETT